MDNNNVCQGLIQTKTIILPIIRTLRPSKDQQTVIKQQHDSSTIVIKSSFIFLMSGDAEMGQHISSIDKPVLREFFSLKKGRRVQICTQEIMYDILLPGILLSRW